VEKFSFCSRVEETATASQWVQLSDAHIYRVEVPGIDYGLIFIAINFVRDLGVANVHAIFR
jgi:hypothetical protein